jgi:hypothetical protein
MKYKVGDVVVNKRSGQLATVMQVNSMPEYVNMDYLDANCGFVLSEYGWERMSNWRKYRKDKIK